jgi:hypothetical protein
MSTANTCDVMKGTRFMIELIMVFQQWLHCKPSGLAAASPLVMQLANDVMRIKQTASKMISHCTAPGKTEFSEYARLMLGTQAPLHTTQLCAPALKCN